MSSAKDIQESISQLPTSEFVLRLLLTNLKKSIELWFLTNNRDYRYFNAKNYTSSIEQIQTIICEILKNGFHLQTNPNTILAYKNFSIEETSDLYSTQKLREDFEWLRRSAQIRDISSDERTTKTNKLDTSTTSHNFTTQNIAEFLRDWILRNLKGNCLCACLQALVTDKELMDCYYNEGAFLRNEAYATAFFMCLSALELNQCGLLSKIDGNLCSTASKHKRSSSHPNFYISMSPPKRTSAMKKVSSTVDGKQIKSICISSQYPNTPITPVPLEIYTVFPIFRKVKSLPNLENTSPPLQQQHVRSSLRARPRSKTLTALPIGTRTQSKTKIESFLKQPQNKITTSSSSTSSPPCADDMLQPSTSNGRRKLSAYSTSSATSMPTSISSTNSTHIEFINCDDIKIWTDQNCEKHQQHQDSNTATKSCAIPQNARSKKQAKNISPINNFLCNLFNTPPTYTSWSLNKNASVTQTESDTTAVPAIYPCNLPQLDNTTASSSGVFEAAFGPVYGQKLRSRKSQNLFDDENIMSSLDYTATDVAATEDTVNTNTPNVSTCLNTINGVENPAPSYNITAQSSANLNPIQCESLTDFLQMAQLSRNSTELEKENAHFRISEAIISAIEHMKWAKIEPDKFRRQNGWFCKYSAAAASQTTVATDWLKNEPTNKNVNAAGTKAHLIDTNRHITYAEIGESCLDLLSAEVVGLSLISKFNDKHLPKVSELKWLVSDEDTPQQLLPMPNNSPTSNLDENIIPSFRGNKHWAPPRQQIIFTDHPPPNCKLLIQQQNNRCAGCGMRVSPQYIHSFRYCTYLGKYLCTGCHRNQITPIPAKILEAWDFKCYPVSVFAYRLLEQIYTYPLFYVPDLNAALYIRNKPLATARQKRVQLKYVWDFIRTCRFASCEQKFFDTIPDYLIADSDIWSMSDFIDTHNKSLQHSIDELIDRCENHIFNCVLCTARGFICEYCKKDKVIYPWEQKVFRCDRCGSCFHIKCWKSMQEKCCKCQRINKRQFDDLIDT